MAVDRARLAAGMRSGPFPGKIAAKQWQGIEAILDAWDASGGTEAADLAYILATPIVETGWAFQPIKERGGDAYFKRMYDIRGERPRKARELGNVRPGDGARFPGMGFVQSTGRGNARKLTRLVAEVFGETVDFEETPERMMESRFAAMALVVGLQRGIYTGKKLADYLRKRPPDWYNARRTVNGVDRAAEIAGYAKQIYADIVHAQT